MYLSPCPDGEHAGLCADTPDLRPGGVGAQPGQQLVPDILHQQREDIVQIFSERTASFVGLNSGHSGDQPTIFSVLTLPEYRYLHTRGFYWNWKSKHINKIGKINTLNV
jgi:hypothetical protein